MKAPVLRVHSIEPLADYLDIVSAGEFQSVTRRDIHRIGDLVVYIPRYSVLPPWISKALGIPEVDIVRPMRLQGVLSEGLLGPIELLLASNIEIPPVGTNVAELLGITKWKPVIPKELLGEVINTEYFFRYEIEDIKYYPNLLVEGEEVEVTEKIHGVCCLVLVREEEELLVSSKDLMKRGMYFKPGIDNLYHRAIYSIKREILTLRNLFNPPIYLLGEVYGVGVQDLHYDTEGRLKMDSPPPIPKFRAFDLFVGEEFLPRSELPKVLNPKGIPTVPFLYKGPFYKDIAKDYSNGQTSKLAKHRMEGIVITNTTKDRVILKAINPSFITRRGGTEYS